MSEPLESAIGIQSMLLSNGLCEKKFAGSFLFRVCEKESVLVVSGVRMQALEWSDIIVGDSFETLA